MCEDLSTRGFILLCVRVLDKIVPKDQEINMGEIGS